jgi:hypothetical protein
VNVEQQFIVLHFSTSGFIFRYVFLDYKIITLLLLTRGDYVNYCGCLQTLKTPEERRHTVMLGVSIGVPGRSDPGPTC